jgi:hypothetical protein
LCNLIDMSSHLIWVSGWKSISRFHWLRRWERFLYLMYGILITANNGLLFICTWPTNDHSVSLISWVLIVTTHYHLSCILCGSSRLAEWARSIYRIRCLLLMKWAVVDNGRVSLWRGYLVWGNHVVLLLLLVARTVIYHVIWKLLVRSDPSTSHAPILHQIILLDLITHLSKLFI